MVSKLYLALAVASAVVADESSYEQNAGCTNDQLMRWYDSGSGLWLMNNGNQYWWQSANMMSAYNDLARQSASPLEHYNYVWDTTYRNAPANNPSAQAVMSAEGFEVKVYTPPTPEEVEARNQTQKRAEVGFVNYFYDDEAWWALAWVGALDITGRREYLDEAIGIWYDMNDAWASTPASCGGLPWNRGYSTQSNAIENELFIQLGAALSNRVGSDQKHIYLDASIRAWDWFKGTGMINSDNLINDGVDPNTCRSNNHPTYSYNQGVILGGLVEMYRATGDSSYLDEAEAIADAVTTPGSSMLNSDGILVDSCDRSHSCSGDGVQFKGVFLRNLRLLQEVRPKNLWKNFIVTNARSIWQHDATFGSACKVGPFWGGPYSTASASSQSSALDCLNAALSATS